MARSIIPALHYQDGQAAIDWLVRAFGFQPHMVVRGDDGTIAHAQLVRGNVMIMLGSSTSSDYAQYVKSPLEMRRYNSQSPYLVVDDPDEVYHRALAAGAEIIIPLKDEDYGGRGFTCRDPEGHLWNFGSYDPWKN
jgi:uncharacterized glyoxalase superfamily protein PhnB